MMEPGTNRSAGRRSAAASLAAWLLAVVPGAALAQSVSDYRLPGSTEPKANPGAQGPVDTDNPMVRGPAPSPVQTPTPSPLPGASVPAASPSAAPIARNPAQPRPVPAPARTGQPVPGDAPPATAAPSPGLPPLVVASPSPSPTPALPTVLSGPAPAFEQTTPNAAEPIDWRRYWPFLAAILASLVAALIAVVLRRRRLHEPAVEFEPPVVREVQPSDPAPLPRADEPRAPLTVPEPPRAPAGLGISLEAQRLSASLMATTLSYRLTLTNTTGQPLSALAIEGDIIAAHASLAPEQQIASNAQRLELRHALVSLAAGERVEFSGDMRLPLTAITPIRAGDAAYFVPLARLRIEASTTAGTPFVEAQTYVIGEISDKPGAALRPFRLDLGPRIYQNVGQRAVA